MDIILNGKVEVLKEELDVNEFLITLEKEKSINLSGAVVLINDDVIKRENWKYTVIKNGDVVEVLSFVSGG